MADKSRQHSLKWIVILLIGTCLVFFSAILFFIFHTNVPKMLLRAESQYLEKQLEVVAGLFDAASKNAGFMAEDIAIWEDAVSFVQGTNPDFIRNNWTERSLLQAYRFNFIVFKDVNAKDVYVEFRDYFSDKSMPAPAGFTEALNSITHETLEGYARTGATPNTELGRQGVHFIDNVPYNMAVMPIISHRGAEEAAGVLFLGTIINSQYFRNLTHYNSLEFSTVEPGSKQKETSSIHRESSQVVSITMPLRDIYGKSALLRMRDSRSVFEEGQTILDRTTALLVLTMLLFVVTLYQIIMRTILRPLESLSRDIQKVESLGDIVGKEYSSSEEFEVLCSSINDMVGRLNASKVSMDVLMSILNGMDAYLYVTDPVTDKILFINNKMAEHYGIQGDPIGKVCWQVLQAGMTQRCDFCPNYKLEKNPGAVVVWEEFSTATKRHYRNTDCLIEWAGSRMVHLQHSIDVTEVKTAEAALQKRLEQQELMSAMSQSFISTADVPDLINNALRMTGPFMDVSEIALIRHHEEERVLRAEYEWRREGGNLSKDQHIEFAFDDTTFEYGAFVRDKKTCLAYADVFNTPELRHLAAYGIRSVIGVPVFVSGAFWGLLCVSEYRERRSWSESDIQLLKLISSIIAGVIERGIMEERLVRMSSIVDSSPQYISYINDKGEFEYFNQGALDLLGYTTEEFETGGIAMLFDTQTHEYIMHELLPRILRDKKAEFVLPIIRKDGQVRSMAFSAFKTDFKEVGVGAIASDITEKLRLERELIEAKEQAEQSSRAKGEFLSRMSHEMRTPMNAIIGMASISRTSKDPVKKEYCLEKIGEASTHLLGVINDILDMSKIEANKFELSYIEFGLEKMLMRVINVINFRVEEKNQNLIINLDHTIPTSIISDEQRLAQVIANLLSNAVKFTPERGSVTLSVTKMSEEGGFCTLKFSVVDTGIGITEDQQAKLFRSFEQADGSISRKFGGTGLGLAISKSIIEMMGGTIWVESEEGHGSNFSFTIQAQKGESCKPALFGPDVSWKNLRILVVDDAPEVREYFMNFAQSVGVECETAEDGFAACRLLEDPNKQFNVVFADWKMPGMNGVELTQKIKSEFGAKVVVIMISATGWSDIEESARAAGVDRFVPKPLFSSAIVDCINECMGCDQYEKEEEALAAQPDQDCFSDYHILLAEDIDINREIVTTLLQHTGLNIDCAENGQQAYDMFRAHPGRYAMIFMDIHMPEVDGYEATKRIRALDTPESREIPIVAMTANVFREDIEKCLAAGMDDHVGKPIDIEEVLAKLRRYLKRLKLLVSRFTLDVCGRAAPQPEVPGAAANSMSRASDTSGMAQFPA